MASIRSSSIQISLENALRSCRTGFCSLRYGCWTLFLFTFSDIKTTLFPAFLFGLINTIQLSDISYERVPIAISWIWLNLLGFCIHNQSSKAAVEEDGINKPWRPLASNRLTLRQSNQLLNIVYLLILLVSTQTGGIHQSLVLLFLNYWYNSWGGSDSGVIIRNLLNCLGFSLYNNGSFRVLSGDPTMWYSLELLHWQIIIASFVFTTVHIQDFPDINGDLQRHRRTLPILLGDHRARSLTAVSILFWSLYIPKWWCAGVSGWMLIIIGGLTTLAFLLPKRNRNADKWAWRTWCLWLLGIYAIPLFAENAGK